MKTLSLSIKVLLLLVSIPIFFNETAVAQMTAGGLQPWGPTDGEGWLLLPKDEAMKIINKGYIATGWNSAGQVVQYRRYKSTFGTITEDNGNVWLAIKFGEVIDGNPFPLSGTTWDTHAPFDKKFNVHVPRYDIVFDKRLYNGMIKGIYAGKHALCGTLNGQTYKFKYYQTTNCSGSLAGEGEFLFNKEFTLIVKGKWISADKSSYGEWTGRKK